MNFHKRRLKILVIQPAPFEPNGTGQENVFWPALPVAPASIRAIVACEHQVRTLDMRFEKDAGLKKALLDFRPDVVGTTPLATNCGQVKAVLETAKATLGPAVFTIVGGFHPALSAADFEAAAVDAICLGEGEETFQELIEHLAGGHSPRELFAVRGLRFRDDFGGYVNTIKRVEQKAGDHHYAPAAGHYNSLLSEEFGMISPGAALKPKTELSGRLTPPAMVRKLNRPTDVCASGN